MLILNIIRRKKSLMAIINCRGRRVIYDPSLRGGIYFLDIELKACSKILIILSIEVSFLSKFVPLASFFVVAWLFLSYLKEAPLS